mmetsp:Transcript_14008/g.38544  ORF Transcript_14008/g.38544 Transcript_14008/m.38544 type:complete len:141 (-) Transcript_14008:818-1240(-)
MQQSYAASGHAIADVLTTFSPPPDNNADHPEAPSASVCMGEATQIWDLTNVAAAEGATLPTALALHPLPGTKLGEEAVAGAAPCQAEGAAWGSGSARPPNRELPSRFSGLSVGKINGLNFGFRMRRFFGVLQFSMSPACP